MSAIYRTFALFLRSTVKKTVKDFHAGKTSMSLPSSRVACAPNFVEYRFNLGLEPNSKWIDSCRYCLDQTNQRAELRS